jgi:hypothetical protein
VDQSGDQFNRARRVTESTRSPVNAGNTSLPAWRTRAFVSNRMRFMTTSRPMDQESGTLRPAGEKPLRTPFEPAKADETSWRASSFDLAQGLDVKVMQSKLSPETLHRLFGS